MASLPICPAGLLKMAAVHLFYLLHGRGRQGEGAALLDKVLTGHDIAVQQAGKLAMQGLARIGQQGEGRPISSLVRRQPAPLFFGQPEQALMQLAGGQENLLKLALQILANGLRWHQDHRRSLSGGRARKRGAKIS